MEVDSTSDQINQAFFFNQQQSQTQEITPQPLVQQIIQLIQDHNQKTLAIYEASIRKLLADLLHSIHSHFSQLQRTTLRHTQQTGNHSNLLNQYSNTNSSKNIHPDLQYSPAYKLGKQGPVSSSASSSSSPPLPPASLDHPSTSLTPATKRKKPDQDGGYDDHRASLSDNISIPTHPSYLSQADQHKSSIERDPPGSNDINVHQLVCSSPHNPLTESSTLLLSAPTKPLSTGSKSSRRQSSILRNLVSSALGKLIAKVTNSQQMHWPGSDTEERLAAIGLQIDLQSGSKLSPEILHKGPKNLQLQQCKRILLELELDMIKLKSIKAVPRPTKKRLQPTHSDDGRKLDQSGLIPDGQSDHRGLANLQDQPRIATASSSKDGRFLNGISCEDSDSGGGLLAASCDPMLAGLGAHDAAQAWLSGASLAHGSPRRRDDTDDRAADAQEVSNKALIERYISSDIHPPPPAPIFAPHLPRLPPHPHERTSAPSPFAPHPPA